MAPNQKDIESEFKELCKRIDDKIDNKEFDSEFGNLIGKLKEEFKHLDEYYSSIGRQHDRLYISHNFYVRYAIWEASRGNASFIASYSTALRLLLERYLVRPYSIESLKNQIKMFTRYMMLLRQDIGVSKDEVHIDLEILVENITSIIGLSETLNRNSNLRGDLISTTRLSAILCWLLKSQIYYTLKLLDGISWKATSTDFNILNQSLDKLNLIVKDFCIENVRLYHAKSIIYEGYFRLYKYLLFNELNKPDNDEAKIRELVRSCQDYSKAAEGHYRKFKKALGEDPHDLVYFGHQIDILMAEYFKLIYVKKKIIKAIKKLGEVKSLLMEKSFDKSFEDLKSMRHIRRISQEYHLLQTYLKLLALYSDVVTLKKQLPDTYDEWVIELFNTLEQELIRLVNEFYKYPRTLDTQHELKMFPRTFIGNFSEYLIYQLLERIRSKGIQLAECSRKEYLNDLLLKINNVLAHDCRVEFRHRPSENPGDPDIDIAVINGDQNLIGISVKNGHLKGNLKDIKREFDLAKKHGFDCFVIVINFLRNIDLIPEITKFKHHLSNERGEIDVYFVDLKDFVECLIDNIQEQDKDFSLPMPKDELLYSLDY